MDSKKLFCILLVGPPHLPSRLKSSLSARRLEERCLEDIRGCISEILSETASNVTEPGVEPGLGDYEPPVQPYTTP